MLVGLTDRKIDPSEVLSNKGKRNIVDIARWRREVN